MPVVSVCNDGILARGIVHCLIGLGAAQVTSLFSGYVRALLAEHASNPGQNWKAKDCAMYLVVALAVRGRTAAAGVTSTNQLVNIQDFFNQQVSCCPPPTKPASILQSRWFALVQ